MNKSTYNKKSLNYCFIQKGNENNDINIEFNWKNLNENCKKNIEINSEKIIKLSEGDKLSKLIIGLSLKYDFMKDKNEQIKLSKLYQVLCKYTTLFAEIEGDKSLDNQMKTFVKNYSVKKIRDFSHENYRMKCFSEKGFRSIRKSSSIKKSAPRGSYLKKKGGDNIYVCALLVIIILLCCYIVKRLIKVIHN